MRSLIMRDVETESEWSHLLGKAMAGRLKGTELKPLITSMVTWRSWKEQYPETTVTTLSRTAGEFTDEFYRDKRSFVFGFVAEGKPYSLSMESISKAVVHGFSVPKALATADGPKERFLVATYQESGTQTSLFSAVLDGKKLSFEVADEQHMRDSETGSLWTLTGGTAVSGPMKGRYLEPVVGIMSFTRAWNNFYPNQQAISF